MRKRGTAKQKKRTAGLALLVSLLCAGMLAGCGSTYSEGTADTVLMKNTASYDTAPAAVEEEVSEEVAAGGMDGGAVLDENAAGRQDRKLIREVNLNVETREFEGLMTYITGRVSELGGYIENSEVYDYSNTDPYAQEQRIRNRNASLRLRVPADRLDSFLAEVSEAANVLYQSENVTDVTLAYVDLESHKKALLTEQDRLLELMEQAEAIEDIIAIEGRLSEVRYQIESMESQLRTYDNQVDYSTVYLNIQEVARMTTVQQNTGVWERIKTGFLSNVENVGYGIKEAAISFVIALPVILVWGVVIGLIVWIITRIWKRRKRRKEKKEKEDGKGNV